MSRIKEAILSKNSVYAGQSPALDLIYGGQNGAMSKIGQVGPDGKNYEEWINNHAYIRKNVIPVVLKYPKFFDLMPDSQKWIDTFVTLMELHPLSIDGLTSGLIFSGSKCPIEANSRTERIKASFEKRSPGFVRNSRRTTFS